MTSALLVTTEMQSTPKTAPNATVLHVELSHVTLTLDSVAVNQESLERSVTAVWMGPLALSRALAVVSATATPRQLSSSRVIPRAVSVPASLESTGQTVDSVLLDTGTMDPTDARSATAEEVAATPGQESAAVLTG